MNEIKVRKIPKKILSGLDGLAKKQKVSREEYVRKLLMTPVESVEIQGVRADYEELLKMSLLVIQNNTDALNKFYLVNVGGEDID